MSKNEKSVKSTKPFIVRGKSVKPSNFSDYYRKNLMGKLRKSDIQLIILDDQD